MKKNSANIEVSEFSTPVSEFSPLIQLIQQKINQLEEKYLIESFFADIMQQGIIINKKYIKIFGISKFDTVYGYVSKDPSYNIIINNLNSIITYTYNNKKFVGDLPTDPNPLVISNFAYFHDIIFGYILKTYKI